MTQRARWGFILLLIFILALPATGYFAWQLSRSAPSPLQAPANFLAADKGYGVTIDLTQYDERQLADTLAALAANGLTWLRLPVVWAELEPAPGQYHWQSLDRIELDGEIVGSSVVRHGGRPAPTA